MFSLAPCGVQHKRWLINKLPWKSQVKRKRKRRLRRRKKRKDAKSRSVPSGEATAAVAVGSEATRRGGQSNGLLVGNQSSAQQLMGGLLLSMQNGEGH